MPPRRSRGSHCGAIVAFERPRVILYEAKLEANIASILLVRPDIIDLREQIEPFHYIAADGSRRSTRFDFLLSLTGNRRVAIAVKPSAIAKKQGFAETLKLISEQMPRSFATEVWLMTERMAPPHSSANARLLLSVRRDPESPDADAVRAAAHRLEGAVTIEALVAASGLYERGFRAVVRCIDRGVLATVDGGMLSPGTSVIRAGCASKETAT